MKIYDKGGHVRINVEVTEKSVYVKSLMEEEYILLSFESNILIPFEKGDYVDTEFGRFYIVYIDKAEEKSGSYQYEQRFHPSWERFRNRITFYSRQQGSEKSWKMTQRPEYFLDIIVDNIKRSGFGEYSFQVDPTLNEMKLVQFDATNIIDALTRIAETWETEWWITDTTIHLRKCEFGSEVPLQKYDTLSEIRRDEGQDKEFCTRLYAFGSTKNLRQNYRKGETSDSVIEAVVERRLKLPAGIDYVDAWENLNPEDIIEGVAIFDDVYPRRTGTVTSVSTKEYTDKTENEDGSVTEVVWNAYRFADSGLSFSEEYVIEGEELRVIFQTGQLAGMEFAVAFNPEGKNEATLESQVFEIVRNEDYGIPLPSDKFGPKIGDTYILYGYDTKFIADYLESDAEQELLEKARDKIAKMSEDKSVYTCTTNPVRCAGYAAEEDGKLIFSNSNVIDLDLGQRVLLIDSNFFPTGSRVSRIRSFEKKLANKYYCTYTVGETGIYSKSSELNQQVEEISYQNQNIVNAYGSSIKVITRHDTTPPSDHNVLSALRSHHEFLNKNKADIAEGKITFVEGIQVGRDFTEGVQGGAIYEKDGNTHAETDYLTVRKKMSVKEVEIQEVKHIGGSQILSATRCKAERVVKSTDETYYRVYFLKTDGEGRTATNDWTVGDQAYVMTFNLETDKTGIFGNRYYWRVVVGVGSEDDYHYIDLSNEETLSGEIFSTIENKQGFDLLSSEPQEGDNIVQLGNRLGIFGRTSAIELSGAGAQSPFIRQYDSITDFNYGNVGVQIKPGDSKFKGKLEVTDGSKGIGRFSDLPDEVNKAVKIGGENLLRNTGFDGDYSSQKMEEFEMIGSEDKVYGQNLEFWTVSDKTKVKSEVSTRSVSGYECRFVSIGSWISQDITLIPEENYVLSFVCYGVVNACGKVKGETLKTTRCRVDVEGTGDVQTIRFEAASLGTSIWDVKLERGKVQTDWCPAREDNDEMVGEFKDLWYLQHAFKGKTEILGGLILSSLIQLGKYQNGKMESVTAGMSGLVEDYNTDVAFWGGGTMKQAINAVNAYKYDAGYQPTEDELADMAKAVITHGGRAILNDIVLRGYVYAKGGVFKGDVNAKRFIVDRTEAPLYENTGTVNQQGLVVNTAYITGRGVYILPELKEGQMVAVKWFNPAYVKYSGTTVTKFVGENNNVLITQKATNIVFHNSVSFGDVETLYEIIGDRNVGEDAKTYWSFVPIGGTIGNTGSGVDSWGPPIDLGEGGGLITPEYKDDTNILPPVGGGIIIQPLPDLSIPT